jgi:hypothetical protein
LLASSKARLVNLVSISLIAIEIKSQNP